MIYTVQHGACPQCKYKFRSRDDEPCQNCCHEYPDQFEPESDTDDRET